MKIVLKVWTLVSVSAKMLFAQNAKSYVFTVEYGAVAATQRRSVILVRRLFVKDATKGRGPRVAVQRRRKTLVPYT